MRPRRSSRAVRGLTLIELLVTLAVAAVLMTIAVPSFLAFQRNSELTSAANGLVASLATARGEAMKTGKPAMVVPADGSSWNSGWVVFLDKDQNEAFTESGDQVIFRQAALASHLSVSASGTADGSAPYILFDGSGYPKKRSSNAPPWGNLTFSIVRNDVADSTRWDQTRRVMISKAGRIRSCRPASASDSQCSGPDSDD
ncbi:hypothetical protein GCM10023165_03900 [Variovorax defluvii]|uniref:Type II secretion system protein H n=1 Tax=Variovorax defluvii TaxID=913761 RepID=A0ABP8GUV0_9BURK